MEKFDCLHFILGKALQQVKQLSKEKLSSYGITSVQFGVLYFLWKKDGQLGSELGERLQMDSATVTGIIDRLEQGGFIERRLDSSDRLQSFCVFNRKRSSSRRTTKSQMDELDSELLSQYDEEKVQEFKQMLFDIGLGLKKGTKAGMFY